MSDETMKESIEGIGKEFAEFKNIHAKELADVQELGAKRAEIDEQFEKVNDVLGKLDEKYNQLIVAQTKPAVEEESKSGIRNPRS